VTRGDGRADPDALLKRIAREEALEPRGMPKVFLGAALRVTRAAVGAARR
jgi:hypothetical protein